MIGKKFDDPLIQRDMKHWSFKVVNGVDNKPVVEVN
jgi:hypothetical protein